MSSYYRSDRLSLSHYDPYAIRMVVAWSCIIVTWWSGSGEIQAWSRQLIGSIVPEITYSVLSGTASNQPTITDIHSGLLTSGLTVLGALYRQLTSRLARYYYGDRTFAAAGSRLWNSLPVQL